VKTCSISFTDVRGVKHTVELTASSLYESAAAALQLFRKNKWIEDRPGPMTRLEIEVHEPAVRHVVTVQQLQKWAESTALTPDDRLKKNRVKMLLNA
jgi:hypothetical protein